MSLDLIKKNKMSLIVGSTFLLSIIAGAYVICDLKSSQVEGIGIHTKSKADIIEKRFPGLSIYEVNRTFSNDMYALQTNKGVIYTNKDFDVIIKGELFNPMTGENLSKKDISDNARIMEFKGGLLKNDLGRIVTDQSLSKYSNITESINEKKAENVKPLGTNPDNLINNQNEIMKGLKEKIEEMKKEKNTNQISFLESADSSPNKSISQPGKGKENAAKTVSEKGANKDHVDVAQIEVSDSFIFYKNNKITKVGYDKNGLQISEADTNKQVKNIVDNIKKKSNSWTIKYPAIGEEKSSIFVFTDPDCAYCKKMHHNVKEINRNGISVYYLFYPRMLSLGLDDYQVKGTIGKMEAIWCAEDNNRAMDTIYGGGYINSGNNRSLCNEKKVNEKKGQFPAFEQYLLGNIMNITGTPLIVKDNGEMITGFGNAQMLIKDVLSK